MNGKAKEYRSTQLREKVMQVVFLIAACISILAVALICIYLFANGLPAIAKIGPFEFLLGTDWRPNADHYGIFPMIIGSIYVTAGAIIVNNESPITDLTTEQVRDIYLGNITDWSELG